MSRLATLRLLTAQRIDATADDPAARYREREGFYARHGMHGPFAGYGRAELAFARWMLARGVLAPEDDPRRPGSAWWRAMNRDLYYYAELASLVREAHLEDQPGHPAPVRHWLAFFAAPSAQRWYRAHNAALFQACLEHRALAEREPEHERAFLAIVLYRILKMQALAEGALGGAPATGLFSDPRVPLAQLFVSMTALYPAHYPARAEDIRDAYFDGLRRLDATWSRRVLELSAVVLPAAKLLRLAAGWLELPGLTRMLVGERLAYPELAPERPRPATRASAPVRRKIVILGGGPAALACAWELSNADDWQEHYELTVYTIGHRLGGKIATGRGPHQRIEEHGLHILQGWYHNTFRMFQEVFDERRARGLDPRAPYATLDAAIVPESATLLTEWRADEGRWRAWQLELPATPERPGRGAPLSLDAMVRKGLALLWAVAFGGPGDAGEANLRGRLARQILGAPAATRVRGRPGDARTPLRAGLTRLGLRLARRLAQAERLVRGRVGDGPARRARALLRAAAGGPGRVDTLVELATVVARGILLDVYDPARDRLDFAAINDLDFREFLARHGASPALLGSAFVRFAYTGLFSDMTEGDHGRLAAGTALRVGLMAAGYKGAFVWKLRAGTGDTLVAPLYQVLRARGVRCEFFHRVDQVHDADTGGIEAISLARQVRLIGATYDPLLRLGELACWPARPDYAQIDRGQAAALQAGDIDLESPWTPWRDVAPVELRRGVDFDEVVLAIPPGGLRHVCREICARRPRFRAMVEGIRTTQTQGVQLWLRPSLAELGLDRAGLGMRPDAAPNLVTYANPLYSWLDLSLLIPMERWDGEAPRSCAYFTGPLPEAGPIPDFEDHGFPERERQRVIDGTRRWLDAHIGFLWPNARVDGRFDPGLLTAAAGTPGPERLAQQYFRANVEPSARYTLAYPGTHRVRLRTDQSGYSNLWLAGDWIDYGLNVGYIEGAITSGLQAAHAIRRRLGLPVCRAPYVGLDPDE